MTLPHMILLAMRSLLSLQCVDAAVLPMEVAELYGCMCSVYIVYISKALKMARRQIADLYPGDPDHVRLVMRRYSYTHGGRVPDNPRDYFHAYALNVPGPLAIRGIWPVPNVGSRHLPDVTLPTVCTVWGPQAALILRPTGPPRGVYEHIALDERPYRYERPYRPVQNEAYLRIYGPDVALDPCDPGVDHQWVDGPARSHVEAIEYDCGVQYMHDFSSLSNQRYRGALQERGQAFLRRYSAHDPNICCEVCYSGVVNFYYRCYLCRRYVGDHPHGTCYSLATNLWAMSNKDMPNRWEVLCSICESEIYHAARESGSDYQRTWFSRPQVPDTLCLGLDPWYYDPLRQATHQELYTPSSSYGHAQTYAYPSHHFAPVPFARARSALGVPYTSARPF